MPLIGPLKTKTPRGRSVGANSDDRLPSMPPERKSAVPTAVLHCIATPTSGRVSCVTHPPDQVVIVRTIDKKANVIRRIAPDHRSDVRESYARSLVGSARQRVRIDQARQQCLHVATLKLHHQSASREIERAGQGAWRRPQLGEKRQCQIGVLRQQQDLVGAAPDQPRLDAAGVARPRGVPAACARPSRWRARMRRHPSGAAATARASARPAAVRSLWRTSATAWRGRRPRPLPLVRGRRCQLLPFKRSPDGS